MATEGAYPPFNEIDKDGNLVGFEVDLQKALCEEINKTTPVKCELMAQDWDGIIPGLLAKKYDAIIASMAITEERQKTIQFSISYQNGPENHRGSDSNHSGKFIKDNFKDSKVKSYGKIEEFYLDLQAGRVDLVFIDAFIAETGFLKTPEGADYEMVGPEYVDPKWFGDGVGLAFRKEDNDLKEMFDNAIRAVYKNGTFKKISDQYFDTFQGDVRRLNDLPVFFSIDTLRFIICLIYRFKTDILKCLIGVAVKAADMAELTRMICRSFDMGVTHFDLANNYGPPAGSAEENFGKILHKELKGYRDEVIISTKAGYDMWDGPYGEWGSKKYLTASLDQSLKRMKLDYVDIFYSHRFDPNTPLEETMEALELAVKQGKALYIGISSYSPLKTVEAKQILKSRNIALLIHQPSYSMINRWVEDDLLRTLEENGVGCIAFSPLAQGMLSDKYLGKTIPKDARAAEKNSFLSKDFLTKDALEKIAALNNIAKKRGQTLSQMAIAWVLRRPEVTSALIGIRNMTQLEENISAVKNLTFSEKELKEIDKYAVTLPVNIWSQSSQH
ncbi:hypothetical protein CHS0354_035315 [Potamilus streckersoni]|uniref:Solute-binding protein family 3/N-terminal domain-containing protein n=1 Tax=Potamilus streckersoni TaxID=2493646 RepID=A0AAE0VNC1_9BIVA|nr:hypothetical protein CHS0354_035315 [Potamilus streckersoni]